MPRRELEAKVYINKSICPLFSGKVVHYYRDVWDRFCFKNGYIEIDVLLENGKLVGLAMGYSVLDRQATQRLIHLQEVRKCYMAKTIKLELEDESCYSVDFDENGYERSENFQRDGEFTLFWIKEISKIIEIENAYGIEFNLRMVDNMDNINKLYDAVDFIYDGINGECNCEITIPVDRIEEDIIEIEEPLFFEERDLPLPDKYIHNVCFRPCASMILPGKIDKKKAIDGIIHVDACCAYRIVDESSE
jgi:hypothetical protein